MRQEIPTSFGDGRFVVERVLGRGGMGVVYEAFDKERDMSVALKTLLHMDADSLYYFKREFRSLHDIVHPNLCTFMELIQDDTSWFLTMELIQGVDFLSYIKSPDSFFDEDRLRKSLEGLCAGLNALHAAGKVHRDIKPSNVMITSDDRVVLLDFGLITEKEIQRQTELGNIIGTAAYMAPEQAETGALSPAADWYAVGVMLYEGLTGRLPFDGHPINIIMNKQMSDPVRPGEIQIGLPNDLENLCFDLLNRDPKSRPNPADFLNLLDAYSATGTHCYVTNVTEFTHGKVFVGRVEELNLLKDAFQKVTEGSFETIVVEGVSGVGKSALVDRFTSDIFSDDDSVVVLNGRCYEHESAPFKAFDGIVEGLIRYLREISDEEASALMPRHPELLVRLFPALKRSEYLGRIPKNKIEIEDPHELQRRSFEAFGEVLALLARQIRLVVVIDDMQWTDRDSLSLFKQLLGDERKPPMLLVLLSRYAKEGIESACDWESIVVERPIRLRLKPLSMSESTELTRIFVGQHESIDIDPELIAAEADGHPMYIGELVHHLVENKGDEWRILRLDEAIWMRVSKLPEMAINILQIICVSGAPMKIEHIKGLVEIRSEDFHKYISLLRAGNFIKSRKLSIGHVVEPFHDRVRESVLLEVDKSGKAASIHLEIGRLFLGLYKDDEIRENIFSIVKHLSAGRELINDEEERLQLAGLNFLAGMVSKDAAAFVSSLIYLNESISIFPKEYWITHYDQMFSLYCEAAKSAYASRNFTFAREILLVATDQVTSTLDKAKVCEILSLCLAAEGKPLEAIDETILMLNQLGVKVTSSSSIYHIILSIIIVKIKLLGKTSKQLSCLPGNRNKLISYAFRLIVNLIDDIYHYRPILTAVLLLKMISLCLKYGIDGNTCLSFQAWAHINSTILKNYTDCYNFGRISLELTDRVKDKSKLGQSLFLYATFVHHWKRPMRETLSYLLYSRDCAYKSGDVIYYDWAGVNYCYHSLMAGVTLDETIKSFEYYKNQSNKEEVRYGHAVFYQTALNLVSLNKNPVELQGTIYQESENLPYFLEKNQKNCLYHYYMCKVFLATFFDESGKTAYKYLLELEELNDVYLGIYLSAILPFYDSLSAIKMKVTASEKFKRTLLRRVRKNQRKYRKIARACPDNHAHKYTLVEAERARVKRKYHKAPTLYDQAIAGAIEQEFTQDAALACEFAADYYREIGDEEKTMAYARDALGHYEKWGALVKVEHVKEKFGIE